VPKRLIKALSDPDPTRAKRAAETMFTMKKIDIAKIEAAARGE
jgi:2-polyprenyl-6-hydroxyphenyl methylase/3-demethylubiquinone-9 3-methyltransferase